MRAHRAAPLALALLAAACGGRPPAPTDAPGGVTTAAPLAAMDAYLDGFHFVNGALDRQIDAHHRCSALSDEFTQCAIFDGNGDDARLIGVEYIVSEAVFRGFSAEERRLWHSHAYEVRAGLLLAPELPAAREAAMMEGLVSTYGKTWHTWDRTLPGSPLPLGIPTLMMSFTADGQIRGDRVDARDLRRGVDREALLERRQAIPQPTVVDGADAWMEGLVVELRSEVIEAPELVQQETALARGGPAQPEE